MSPFEDGFDEALAGWEAEGLLRRRRIRGGGAEAAAEGALFAGGTRMVGFASNDYLGYSVHPALVAAACDAARTWGTGSGASPLVTGWTELHAALEEEIARFEGTEAALVFGSGFAANLGTLSALLGPEDFVVGDKLNHASLIDGCRQSGATFRVFRHNQLDDLEKKLQTAAGFRRRLVVVDSLFSMDGDFSPLAEIAPLARRYDAGLMVDEAHATGVFGAGGRGLCEMFGVQDDVTVKMGTLSKALGGVGGFVAGSRSLVEWLANKARPYVYSTAPSPIAMAAALAALKLVETDPEPRQRLLANAAWLRTRLQEQGWDVGPGTSQIIPVLLGEPQNAVAASAWLAARGFWAPAIRPPTVPPKTARLRISLSAAHSTADLEAFAAALDELRRNMGGLV